MLSLSLSASLGKSSVAIRSFDKKRSTSLIPVRYSSSGFENVRCLSWAAELDSLPLMIVKERERKSRLILRRSLGTLDAFEAVPICSLEIKCIPARRNAPLSEKGSRYLERRHIVVANNRTF